jgi:16S rRNA pseudouridine516 synthase
MSVTRLDRLLANLGYGSRREIDALARNGLVTLDGTALTRGDTRVTLADDLPERLQVRARPLDPLPGLVIVLHKPTGVTCSHKETGPLVFDVLPDRWRARDPAISTVGRLDKDTSGVLLLTDDGGWLHKVIAPRSGVSKRYQVTLARPLQGHEADALAAGDLMLEGETRPLLPVGMVVHGETRCEVTLSEGRYHQVRRMFAALGNHVEALHRDRIGGLDLPDDLAPGQWRLAKAEERAAVFAI